MVKHYATAREQTYAFYEYLHFPKSRRRIENTDPRVGLPAILNPLPPKMTPLYPRAVNT